MYSSGSSSDKPGAATWVYPDLLCMRLTARRTPPAIKTIPAAADATAPVATPAEDVFEDQGSETKGMLKVLFRRRVVVTELHTNNLLVPAPIPSFLPFLPFFDFRARSSCFELLHPFFPFFPFP